MKTAWFSECRECVHGETISDMVESVISLQQTVGDQSVCICGFNILHVDLGMDYRGFAEA